MAKRQGRKIKTYDFSNFYYATVGDWIRCEIPDHSPDFVSYSGSAYWHYGKRVRRLSDHWGKVASCIWLLEGEHARAFVCAEILYEDFRSVATLRDDVEILFEMQDYHG